jgi:dTDP-4-dehydrorhamnose reductase
MHMDTNTPEQRKNLLILGAKGVLGQALSQEFRMAGYVVAAWDINDIDLTDSEATLAKISALAPAVIINAAAYNAVDACETDDDEYRKALVLNRDVPGYLARFAAEQGIVFVHYSTDYVFDGENETGYTEDAEPHPISRYGTSKFEGEKDVLAAGGNAYLIRLSKLFGEPAVSKLGKRSFFEVMLTKSKAETRIEVVDDERSCFTYAPDLAQATRELIEDAPGPGIYHLPNEGAATWFEAARELFRRADLSVEVVPLSAEGYLRLARRPHASILINTKRPKRRPYTEALAEFLESLSFPS